MRVIDETLERATDPKLKPQSLGTALTKAVDADLPATLTERGAALSPARRLDRARDRAA
jgi:hypothetical protein